VLEGLVEVLTVLAWSETLRLLDARVRLLDAKLREEPHLASQIKLHNDKLHTNEAFTSTKL
jgi:hypothetical protein